MLSMIHITASFDERRFLVDHLPSSQAVERHCHYYSFGSDNLFSDMEQDVTEDPSKLVVKKFIAVIKVFVMCCNNVISQPALMSAKGFCVNHIDSLSDFV